MANHANSGEENRQAQYTETQSDDKKPEDYNQLKSVATLGLNIALFSNTVADLKNIYDIKVTNDSMDAVVVLWVLRMSFILQLSVALLAVIMYVMNRSDARIKNKKGTKKQSTTRICKKSSRARNKKGTSKKQYTRYEELCINDESEIDKFQTGCLWCWLTIYQMMYVTSLICILIITTLQVIASIWIGSLGIEMKSAHEEFVSESKDL